MAQCDLLVVIVIILIAGLRVPLSLPLSPPHIQEEEKPQNGIDLRKLKYEVSSVADGLSPSKEEVRWVKEVLIIGGEAVQTKPHSQPAPNPQFCPSTQSHVNPELLGSFTW